MRKRPCRAQILLDAQRRQELEALAQLNNLRAEMARAYGIYRGDLVAEARAEWEAEAERVQQAGGQHAGRD